MAHDVFISYSTKDKPIADGICANIEAAGVRCWIAPRDIAPGEDWPTAITTAIKQSRAMVLVFSANSNSSEDVGREIMLAANSRLVIIPFKIDDVEPEPGKQYYLARTHWLDAVNPPTREQILRLVETVKSFVATARPDPRGGESPAGDDDQPTGSPPGPEPGPLPPPGPVIKVKRRLAWLYVVPVALIGAAGIFYALNLFANLSATTVPSSTVMASNAGQTTATRTRIPTEPGMDVNVLDVFSGNAYDWPVLLNENDSYSIQNMHIQNGELSWSMDCLLQDGCLYFYNADLPPVSDFDASVDVKRTSTTQHGHAGLTFRIQDGSNFYMFAVDDTQRSFTVWTVLYGKVTRVVDWTSSGAIRYLNTNNLAISARDTLYTFYINGERVASEEIHGISQGYVGIESQADSLGTVTVVFDNFELNGDSAK